MKNLRTALAVVFLVAAGAFAGGYLARPAFNRGGLGLVLAVLVTVALMVLSVFVSRLLGLSEPMRGANQRLLMAVGAVVLLGAAAYVLVHRYPSLVDYVPLVVVAGGVAILLKRLIGKNARPGS